MPVTETSRLAKKEIEKNLGRRQLLVYRLLRKTRQPMTNREISEALQVPINEITPRVFELRTDKGLVELGCLRPCRITGKKARAWKLVGKQMQLI